MVFISLEINHCDQETFCRKTKIDRSLKDMDLDLDHFLNLEQLIPAGFTVAKGSIF